MKLDLLLDLYEIKMREPHLVGRVKLNWSDTPAHLWMAEMYGRKGKVSVTYQSSVMQSQEGYIPDVRDFLYTLQSIALSDIRSSDEDELLNDAWSAFGPGSVYDLCETEIYTEEESHAL